MERFLLLADIHGNIKALKKAVSSEPQADYVIIAGDLPLTTPFSLILTFALLSRSLDRERYSYWVYRQNRERFVKFQRQSVSKALDFLAKQDKEVIYVTGNVECRETGKLFADHSWLQVIDNRCVKIGDYWWAGIPGSLIHIKQGICDREFGESEMARQCKSVALQAAGKKDLILVTHEPPFFTSQETARLKKKKQRYSYHFKQAGGSKHVTELIDQLRPLFVVNGHYHEYPGHRHVHGTSVINPGCLANYRYALVYKDGKRMKTVFRHLRQRGFDFIRWIYSQRNS
ncbi:MAG: metallophosphoesterase [Candidatus Odinarchaeota archaeon]